VLRNTLAGSKTVVSISQDATVEQRSKALKRRKVVFLGLAHTHIQFVMHHKKEVDSGAELKKGTVL